MHVIQADRIKYDKKTDDNNLFSVPVLNSYTSSNVEVIGLTEMWKEKFQDSRYESFDQWGRLLDREIEVDFCNPRLEPRVTFGKRVHIRGVSCAEVVELLREYYSQQDYFTDYPRKCRVPLVEAAFTASINIRNLVYSSKDKNKLPNRPVYPPIRSSSDQRIILTGLRTGVIIGIEVDPGDEGLIEIVFHEEILQPFELGRLLCWNFVDRAFNQDIRHHNVKIL